MFTLDRSYRRPRELIRAGLLPILELPGVDLPDKRIYRRVFELYVDLNISFAGIFAFSKRIMVGENHDIRLLAPMDTFEVAERNRDVLIGIKVRIGRHGSGEHGLAPLKVGRQSMKVTTSKTIPRLWKKLI